ncbi:MAG: ABC transporter permease [Desulfobacca sp.]|uniref:ABC transporter permease n=1 Tax=Desulfobacca sp. TaxID=2067990 RepID=UPI004049C7B7
MFKLILRNSLRHRLRTALTILGMAIAILSFGLLRTVVDAWYAGVEGAAPDRLVTRNAISLIFRLPLAYLNKIKAIPGIKRVTYGYWFGGVYIDEKNFFPQFAVALQHYLDIYQEFIIPPEQRQALLKERNACVAGRKLAQRFGWRLGDIITLRGTIFPGNWELVLRAIYQGADEGTDETRFFFHWDYVNETLVKTTPAIANQVGWFISQVEDIDRAPRLAAQIDDSFRNSLAETLTESEKAFQLGFVSMTKAIIMAIQIVSYVVIAIILIVLANTMAMTARERQEEHAVLKTLGFQGRHLIVLIAGESVAIALMGGLVGLIALFPAAHYFRTALGNYFRVFNVSDQTLVTCLVIAVSVGLVSAIVPAWRAARLSIAEGLRRIG